MASRAQAPKGAESTAKDRQTTPSTDEASKQLKELLDQAAPKDAEQPKPAKRGNGNKQGKQEAAKPDAKPEAAKKDAKEAEPKEKAKPLAENELSGAAKDGEKLRIGLPYVGGSKEGEIASFGVVVPTKFYLAKPTKGRLVHVIDEANPKKTLCNLTTESWMDGPLI